VLLYIGIAHQQEFACRLSAHLKNWEKGEYEVYVGRILGERAPRYDYWAQWIQDAEKLLIFACAPAYNCRDIKEKPGLRKLHILNWGNYGDIFPEISTARTIDAMPYPKVLKMR